jgi:RecG-like helicase
MTTQNSNDDEQIRKIYINTLKSGDVLQTVFKATKKERLASRAGKPYLSLALVDRTGEIEGRVFDNVEVAEGAFSAGDYLLVKGKIGAFHGKLQMVVEQLERLDAGPIDAAEFEYTAPPKEEKREKERPEKFENTDARPGKRLQKLLQNPQTARALEELLVHFEHYIDTRIAEKLGHAPPVQASKSERHSEKRHRGPRVDVKPHMRGSSDNENKSAENKPELKRDASLPEGLAFKPLAALVTEEPKV